MRRGGGGGNDSLSMRPSYRSTTSAGGASGTILVNLDVFIQRATVGHDISPLDEDLIVLFRRNSKEITSEPTRWHSDHVAEWNQHVGIQTSLLRGKKPATAINANGAYSNEFLKKEYEVVLVAALSIDEDTDMNSASSSDGGPKTVELDDDYVSAKQQDKQKALEKQIQQFQESLDDSYKKLAVKEQELAALREHMSNREQGTTTLEGAKKNLENELEEVLKMLMKAQERTTELEGQVKQLQQQLESAQQRASTAESASTPPPSVPSSPSSLVINTGDRGDEVAELTKQLKLSKQEVMQLRYRSNQMESVNERLEEALKEKRTLQVKLTALEGQLYEHRSRTISDNTFATDQNAMVSELQKQLDQRSAQLLISQRELEMMKRELTSRPNTTSAAIASGVADIATSSTDIDELSAKVKKFELEITRLCDRNEEQAKKLDVLGDHIATVTRERAELQEICQQMVQEMDNMARLHGGEPSHSDDDAHYQVEEEELEEKAPPATFAPVSVTLPAMITTKKVTDRYLAANNKVASPARQVDAPVAATGAGASKIAHLIKNFSSDESSEASTSDGAVRKPKKFDFRSRNGSNASASSRSTSTSTGSVVEAMAARFQSGVAVPIEE
uniref:C2 NT-type domain-containing protein n=1 Tax=Globisporangium ultimum (strain ATCC 200006 / CBS 805.95 / DAOM BR144) TaxID=431595 RepID=K3WFB6_GLOUD